MKKKSHSNVTIVGLDLLKNITSILKFMKQKSHFIAISSILYLLTRLPWTSKHNSVYIWGQRSLFMYNLWYYLFYWNRPKKNIAYSLSKNLVTSVTFKRFHHGLMQYEFVNFNKVENFKYKFDIQMNFIFHGLM